MSSALARAKSHDKRLFLHFVAPWCAYCKRLDAFLLDREAAPLIERAFIPVRVDVERMTGGKEMAIRYGQSDADGIPFFAILAPTGRKLADSRESKGNVGFPIDPHEIAHFMKIVSNAGTHFTPGELQLIERRVRSYR